MLNVHNERKDQLLTKKYKIKTFKLFLNDMDDISYLLVWMIHKNMQSKQETQNIDYF